MQMSYNQVVEKLKELDSVIQAYETAIRSAQSRNYKYMNVPISCLNRDMELLKSKIDHLKSNAIVTYDSDTKELDELLKSGVPEGEE